MDVDANINGAAFGDGELDRGGGFVGERDGVVAWRPIHVKEGTGLGEADLGAVEENGGLQFGAEDGVAVDDDAADVGRERRKGVFGGVKDGE